MKPERGQIIVTERVEPFLNYPLSTLRQTDEGTVLIGDSREDGTDPAGMTMEINGVMASRAVKIFPRLASLNVVRTWRAIRVMPQDGFPIYDQSTTHPGAFLVTCHSGVTLAAGHALNLAPMIAGDIWTRRASVHSVPGGSMLKRLSEAVEARVTIRVDGNDVTAAAGDTVAAALLAAGVTAFRKAPVGGADRAPYCMMGVCFDCLVTIDGVGNRQACLVPVRDGMEITTGLGKRSVSA